MKAKIRISLSLAFTFVLEASALPGCTVPNPAYCSDDAKCGPGKYCDLGAHRCVPTQCGNGVIEGDEPCDGPALGNQTCQSAVGLPHGTLSCSSDCTLDTSGCHTCGNGILEADEACDGAELDSATCTSLGFLGGDLSCTETCEYDTSSCVSCGNGAIDPGEECDDQSLGGASCENLGYSGGDLACSSNCTLDESGCFLCGDGACDHDKGETSGLCPQDCGWAKIAAGGKHTCGLKNDGTVWCWGINITGQLGDGATHQFCGADACSLDPVHVVDLADVTNVSTTLVHTCALQSDGKVFCWGDGEYGQLGDGGTENRFTPVKVQTSQVLDKITCGALHTCASVASGPVLCWGYSFQNTPILVPNLVSVSALSAGSAHTCALTQNSIVTCWGYNENGQLGDGTTNNSSVPVPVQGLSNVVSINVGPAHSCASLSSGHVYCWGNNRDGQLGDGTTENRLLPVLVQNIQDASSVVTGGFHVLYFFSHSCVAHINGTMSCWGSNEGGQIGNGLSGSYYTAPVQVLGLSTVQSMSAGGIHTCAITSDSTAWCWGLNDKGQLGNGTQDNVSHPVQVIDPYE